jgi:pyridoxine 4-dehydrogenase
MAVGRLTGKYNDHNHPRGNRNFGHVRWQKLQPIVDELVRIGKKEGKTPSAVANNWVICKGAIPIPTPKNSEQAEDLLQSLGWRLSDEDERRLDAVGLTNAWDYNLLKHFQNW